MTRAGALRSLTAFLAEIDADIFCIHEIDAGDALALATRFDRAWGYRGGQALFWNARVSAHTVHDRYLPLTPLRPFDRRGLLEVDAETHGARLTLVATQFANDRAVRVRELRYARSNLRAQGGAALLFVAQPDPRIGFADLGLHEVITAHELACYVREFKPIEARVETGLPFGAALVATMTL